MVEKFVLIEKQTQGPDCSSHIRHDRHNIMRQAFRSVQGFLELLLPISSLRRLLRLQKTSETCHNFLHLQTSFYYRSFCL